MTLSAPSPAAGPDPVARASEVDVVLGGQPVLHRVSLEVGAGETVALMGGNGSGKSTLVRALVGLTPVSHGRVELFGVPTAKFRRWADVGYVPQRSVLGLAGATVTEVVGSGRLARRTPFLPQRRVDREAVAEALDVVRLGNRARDEMAHLSGGQQQRVLIARALAGGPRLLLLDEPVAGVDLEQQQVLTEVFDRLVRRGVSILVVLHEVGPLGSLVHRTVVLRDGKVVRTRPGAPGPDSHISHDGLAGHAGHETEPPAAPVRHSWATDPVGRPVGHPVRSDREHG